MLYTEGMKTAFVLCLGFTVAFTAVLPDPPCVCTFDYRPVCGSDGNTYSNRCSLECEKNVSVVHEGQCEVPPQTSHDCICSRIYRPVCGENGRTYSNECEMKCEGVSKLAEGPCPQKSQVQQPAPAAPPCICTLIYLPVCGTNGRTYGNRCQLNCKKNVTFAHTGACSDVQDPVAPPCACPFILRPVCGSDGVTYSNECGMKCAGVSKVAEGRCPAVDPKPPCICTMDYQPVCGDDGKTYGNKCSLDCAGANIATYGECSTQTKLVRLLNSEPEPRPCICPFLLDPKCGIDGKTYVNECEMNCNAMSKSHDGACISVIH